MSNPITIINTGVNGHNTADLLFRLEECVLSQNPELVIMMVGTNDMLNDANILPVEDYEANYQRLIDLITRQSKLIIMTIPPVDSDAIIRRVPPGLYAHTTPSEKVDLANVVIRKLAVENDLSLIDLFTILQSCGGATSNVNSLFMNEVNFNLNDGVHPTVDGYRVIGTAVYLAVSLLFPDVTRIVCFGDSITYGYKMQGEGTVEGDPYPAVLYRMLSNSCC